MFYGNSRYTYAIHIDPLGYLFIKYPGFFVFLASDRFELKKIALFGWNFGGSLGGSFYYKIFLQTAQMWLRRHPQGEFAERSKSKSEFLLRKGQASVATRRSSVIYVILIHNLQGLMQPLDDAVFRYSQAVLTLGHTCKNCQFAKLESSSMT